jgi:hypothetical protein
MGVIVSVLIMTVLYSDGDLCHELNWIKLYYLISISRKKAFKAFLCVINFKSKIQY